MSARPSIDRQEMRRIILARLDELKADIQAAHDAARPRELDSAQVGRLSRFDQLHDQELAQEAERRHLAEIRRIEAALERLDQGSYGRCAECGAAIPVARLRFDPTTPFCVACASRR